MASSSRLGSRAGELLFVRVASPKRIQPHFPSLGCRSPTARSFASRPKQAGSISRAVLEQITPRVESQNSPRLEISSRKQSNLSEVAAEALSIVMPGTFVLPPLSQFPRPLGQKFRLLGYWIVIKGQETITNAFHRFMSKPTLFSRARFKPKRSTLIPTAKAMHRAMAEALASGDKDTINKVCGRRLASQLLASIDARPRGRRYGWELVGYTNKLFYPSVKSHKISPVSRERHAPIIQQAVVAISSRQRRVEYDAHGQVVPGSEKEIEVVENVAISCMVDTRTWTQGEWRVVGSVRPTTLEGWKAEAELLKTTMLQQ